ncbi:MAG: NUDIX hydrolase [Leptolyngbyaceae cyanobacterium MO_188.B28]|nr:NUDIX hydrolase [Leptolyngbyaceae cyanobacterium MO_188.B28]
MSVQRIEVTLAILHQDNHFLMQLRDDFPDIAYPGCWGFFGGHLEQGESPDAGIKRELWEEIGYTPPTLTLFNRYIDDRVLRYVYHAPLTPSIGELVLTEGQDLGLCSPEEVRQGYRYSAKIQETRPLGEIHQTILLDFLAKSDLVSSG